MKQEGKTRGKTKQELCGSENEPQKDMKYNEIVEWKSTQCMLGNLDMMIGTW
jgi:hypothetical protein